MRGIVLLALLSVASPALAMDYATLVKEARAHHAKLGKAVGDLKITQVGTFAATGAGGSSIESTTWRKGLKWRTDGTMSMGGGKGQTMNTTTLFDGKDLWSIAMGVKTKVPAGQASDASSSSYWSDPPEGSRVTGAEKVGGRDCWVVEFPAASANPAIQAPRTRVWIDQASFVFVRSESQLSGKTVRTSFSDFRKIQGYEIPHLVTVASDGKTSMTSKITKLETHAGLADDLFDAGKLGGAASGVSGTPGTIDVEALMKQAEEMKKKMEAQGKGRK